MDLDVDQFQNALEKLKSIVQDDSSGSVNNSIKKVVAKVKNKNKASNINGIFSPIRNDTNVVNSDDDCENVMMRNPIKERLRSNLDLFESDLSIGKSVLSSSKYATQLGFKQQLTNSPYSPNFNYNYDYLTSNRSSSLHNRRKLISSNYSTNRNLKHCESFFISKHGRNLTYANLKTIDDKCSLKSSLSRQSSSKIARENSSTFDKNFVKAKKKLNSAPPNSFLQRLNDELYKLELEKNTNNQDSQKIVLKEINTENQPSDYDVTSPHNSIDFSNLKHDKTKFESLPVIVNNSNQNENRNLSLPITNDSNNSTITTANNATLNKKKTIRLKRVENVFALNRFKKAIKMITILLKAISSIKKDNQLELNERDTYQRVDMYGLIFDVNYYKKPKEIGLNDEAKRILKMAVEKRTEEQIKIAVSSLLEAVPEYQDFPINMQKSIASVSVLQEFEAGRVIIRQDHKADNFYFIVSGMTAVSVSEHNSLTGEPSSKVVAYLSKGRSFGELAIIHAAKRNATVTCSTNVSILCIEREDFIDIFMHYEKGQEPEHITFLRDIDVLKGWPIERLPHNDHRICLITYFRKGILMCKDSNKNDWIYVIKQGSCRIIKDIPLSKESIGTIEKSIEVAHKSMEFELKSARSASREDESGKSAINKKEKIFKMLKNKSVYTEVLQIGVKDTFGLVDVLFGNIEGATSVSLVSDGAECILINKSFFSKHLPDDMRKKLRETVAPYPKDIEIQKKFLNNIYWQTYKKNTINEIYEKMKIIAV